MDINWTKLKEEKYQAGHRKMIKRTYKLPNSETASYDIVDFGAGVCVLALTPEKQVITVKVYRPGPEKILRELPGGFVDEGFTPEEAMKKELLEETGYAGDFKFIGTSYQDAYTTTFRYNFVATNCKKVQEPELESDERGMVTELLSIEEFIRHLKTGEMTGTETGYIGLIELGYLKYSLG